MKNLREITFWSLDFLTGCKKIKEYNDIKSNQNNTNKKINEILMYAVKHVKYYENLKFDSLYDFPVMNKTIFKNLKKEQYISDEFYNKKLHRVITSGSTGTPFEVFQNKQKRNRVICDLINCHNNLNWRLGNRFVFIRNWVSNYKQSKIKSIMQNVKTFNTINFDDNEKKYLTDYLLKHKETILFGYASSIIDYTNYLIKNKVNSKLLNIKLIVTDSDELSHANYLLLKNFFNVPVYNRYDNEENGLLGISRDNDEKIYLNTNSLYFEILKIDSNETADPGEIGRIVITDFYNKAMPLIRYDTGDLGMTYDDMKNIRKLNELSGRIAGMITNETGNIISNVSLSALFESFVEIERYQIIQMPNNIYNIKYTGNINDEENLMHQLKSYFGKKSVIKINKVDYFEIEKNGKFKTTIRIFDKKDDKNVDN